MATKTTKKRSASKKESASAVEGTQPELNELFINGIRDLYWAENHLVKALPKMKSASSAKELQKAIADHLEVTKGHVSRLEQIFEMLEQKAIARKCDAMEGLTLEGEGTIEDTTDESAARNLGITQSCQKVEHYEISAYTGVIELATALGYPEIATLLNETLVEEQESSTLLTEISANILA